MPCCSGCRAPTSHSYRRLPSPQCPRPRAPRGARASDRRGLHCLACVQANLRWTGASCRHRRTTGHLRARTPPSFPHNTVRPRPSALCTSAANPPHALLRPTPPPLTLCFALPPPPHTHFASPCPPHTLHLALPPPPPTHTRFASPPPPHTHTSLGPPSLPPPPPQHRMSRSSLPLRMRPLPTGQSGSLTCHVPRVLHNGFHRGLGAAVPAASQWQQRVQGVS